MPVGALAWHRLSFSPRAPESFSADPEQVALGRALAARIADATRMTGEAIAVAGLFELTSRQLAKQIRDVHNLTSRAIARFLITGQGTTETERNFIGRIGVVAVRYGVSLSTLTRSYILWRDNNLRVLNEEVKRLRTAVAISEQTRLLISSSARTGILRMALAYDEPREVVPAVAVHDSRALVSLANQESSARLQLSSRPAS